MIKKKLPCDYPRGKKWVFTWFDSPESSFVPSKADNSKNLKLLKNFCNRYCVDETDGFICQMEMGEKKKNLHIQGRFELKDGRVYKSILLTYFHKIGIHNDGLYLDVEKDTDKSKYYVTKSKTRILGPFNNKHFIEYLGNDIAYIKNSSTKWQKAASLLLKIKQIRKINFIYSIDGNAGKTTWVKNCIINSAYFGINANYFSLSDVSRVLAGICSLKEDPDTIFLDIPKTLGRNQSYQDLFSAIEQIKNGLVESNYYGKHRERFFPPPNVFITANIPPSKFIDFIASDRWEIWEVFPIGNETIYKHKIYIENKHKFHKRESTVDILDNKIVYNKI